jgi:histidinol dehydrogenase
MTEILHAREAGFEAAFAKFLIAKRNTQSDIDAAVARIVADVRARGDEAVLDYTRRFDRVTLSASQLRVGEADMAAARSAVRGEDIAALEMAAARISAYHARQRPADDYFTDGDGIGLGHRWTAIDRVGLYVPGGTASYPSSVLMNALPARAAGVRRLAMAVPAPDGLINPLVLVAAELAGITEIYRMGGAQAVAALAYGTPSIEPVDKIVGPGNAYVTAAKRQVFGQVGIDMIAGPSEILVVADAANDPAWIAADLLSQAEHDENAQAILMTDEEDFAKDVLRAIERGLQSLPRGETARESWMRHGAVIVVDDLRQAPMLIDRIAPEHLELALEDAENLLSQVHHAGAIFLGRYTPEAIGDYVAGPSHVLPTARSARFSSGLSVLDFLKRSSIMACSEEGFAKIAPAAARLARAEGLTAHERSLTLRLGGGKDEDML